VVTQMSAGDGFGCGADVGWGWTLSQGRGGQGIDSDVGGHDPSPVVSDERSPKCRCGRIGVSCTKLRCAARTHSMYDACSPSGRKIKVHRATTVPQACPTRHSVRRRRRSGRTPRRIAACRSRQRTASAPSRQLAVTAPGCNRWRCVATDCAALQRMPLRATAGGAMQRGGALLQAALRCNQFRLSGWAHSSGALGQL
jgi:hypothetical protein